MCNGIDTKFTVCPKHTRVNVGSKCYHMQNHLIFLRDLTSEPVQTFLVRAKIPGDAVIVPERTAVKPLQDLHPPPPLVFHLMWADTRTVIVEEL